MNDKLEKPETNYVSIYQSAFPFDDSVPKSSKNGNGFASDADNSALHYKVLVSLLGLSLVKGIGTAKLQAFYDCGFLDSYAGTTEKATLAAKDLKVPTTLLALILKNRIEILQTGEKEAQNLEKLGIYFISSKMSSYPPCFREMDDPPRWLFVKGNIAALHSNDTVGIVGTRDSSEEGENLALRCGSEFALRNFVVVSGLAKGIDEKAHQGAVANLGESVAVLAHGLAIPHVYTNYALSSSIIRRGGTLVSEYLPVEPPSRDAYLRRNELIAALSNLLIPIELQSLQSGTGSTIRRAMRLKTPIIGVIPANTTVNSLIETRNILESLECPVFTVLTEENSALWTYVRDLFPANDWVTLLSSGKQRFLIRLARQFVGSNKELNLSGEDADQLAQYIKRLLRSRSPT